MSPEYLFKFENLPTTYPILGLVLALIVALVIFHLKFKHGTLGSLITRALILLILTFALASPIIEKTSYRSEGLLLLDVSDSMEPETAKSLLKKAESYIKAGFDYQVLPFAERPAKTLLKASMAENFSKVQNAWNNLNIGATNLENAFKSPYVAGVGNVLLISDGFETAGDSFSKLTDLQNAGVKVFPLVLDNTVASGAGLKFSNLYAPLVVTANKSTDLRISVENLSSQSEQGLLKVFQEEKKIFEKEVTVNPKEEAVFIATTEPFLEGIKEFSVSLEPVAGKNNFASSSEQFFISAEEKEKVLLLASSSKETAQLKTILEEQSYQLDTKITLGKRLAEEIDFSKYSVVIFNNVPLNELPRGVATQVEKYVANGGGFIMLGGNKSFGLGGYKDTAIADVLPVNVETPKKEKKRLNVAVQLVLDKSASMNQDNRMLFVKSAAAEVLKYLKNEDYVGIIGFDDFPFHLVPIERVATARSKAIQRLRQLYPAKTTRLLAALTMAKDDILKAPAGRKHIIVLTDGKLPDFENYDFYMQLVDLLRISGVTLSTFVIGNDYVPILIEMADRGGGAFYRTSNPANLPKLFLQDVEVNTGEKTQKENQRFNVRTSQLVSTKLEQFPPLLGYIETKIKPKAKLELYLDGEKKDPLLASWNYKKGKSVAFTSDVSGRWSEFWIGWSKIHTFWADLVDSVRSNSGEQNIQFEMRHFVNQGKLYFDLSIYSEGTSGDVRAEIIKPDQTVQNLNFTQLARGHYQVAVSDLMAGRYELKTFVGSKKLTPMAVKISGELFGEKKGQGFATTTLEAIATSTGAKVNPEIADLASNQKKIIENIPLNNWLCLLAFLLFCLEIAQNNLHLRLFKK